MNRNLVLDRLAQLDHQLARGEVYLNSQRAAVRRLEHGGEDATAAREVLATYVMSQAGLLATRDRLRAELVQMEVYANM